MADQADSNLVNKDETDAGPDPSDIPPPRRRGSGDHAPHMEFSEFWSDHYKMDHEERGLAYIINNVNFDEKTGLKSREGSNRDAERMHSLFRTLGFKEADIVKKDDLSTKKMKDLLETAATIDYKNKDCFVCVILSYGDEGYVYGYEDKIEIDTLLKPLKRCHSLAGKPKLFFIQACRGALFDAVVSDDAESGESYDVRRIPSESDFFMACSIIPGTLAWRKPNFCSWFIQAVSDILKEHWKRKDFLTMMTHVNRQIAREFLAHPSISALSNKKHIPCITSMLTKDLFF